MHPNDNEQQSGSTAGGDDQNQNSDLQHQSGDQQNGGEGTGEQNDQSDDAGGDSRQEQFNKDGSEEVASGENLHADKQSADQSGGVNTKNLGNNAGKLADGERPPGTVNVGPGKAADDPSRHRI